VLEFDNGLGQRPIVRPATTPECIADGGTRVRVWPRGVRDTTAAWIGANLHEPPFAARVLHMRPVEAAYWLSPTLDVNLFAEQALNRRHRLIRAGDWRRLRGKQLLARTGQHGRASHELFAGNVRALHRDDQVVGRACIVPEGDGGVITVGGFRATTRLRVAGVLLGESRRTTRDEANVLVTPEELARWATEQAELIAPMLVSDSTKAECARIIGVLGGKIGTLPIAKRAGTWLSVEGVTEWSRDKECIVLITEADEETVAAGSEPDEFLVEPSGYDEFIIGSRFDAHPGQRGGMRWRCARRPVLDAIAAAWAPDNLDVCNTTRWIQLWIGTTTTKHDGVEISCEEVRRRKTTRT
jgi:hypothetical protein